MVAFVTRIAVEATDGDVKRAIRWVARPWETVLEAMKSGLALVVGRPALMPASHSPTPR